MEPRFRVFGSYPLQLLDMIRTLSHATLPVSSAVANLHRSSLVAWARVLLFKNIPLMGLNVRETAIK